MGILRAAWTAVVDALTPPRYTLDLEPLHTFDTAPRPVDRVLAEMKASTSVSRDMAMQVPAVQRGRNDICQISTLPLRLYRGLDVVDSPLFRQYDPDVPNVVHMAMTVEDLALVKVAWWRKTALDFDGYPIAARRVDPARVTTTPPNPQAASAALNGKFVWIRTDDDKGYEQVPASQMIRFDSPNPGILKACARAVRIAFKLDTLTEMYAENPSLREYFTDGDDPDTDKLEEHEVDEFLAEYGAMRQVRPFAWIPSTIKRADMTVPSARDMTLVDLRQAVNLSLANGLGVDPEDLGVSTTSRTYQNAVDRKQDKINRVYSAYMAAITDRLAMGDVTRRGYTPRFDLTEFLRSDPNTQADYWQKLRGMGVVDEIWIGEQAGVSPDVTARAMRAKASAQLDATAIGQNSRRPAIQLGDITPARQFAASRAQHTFAAAEMGADPATVDSEKRTITGLAVPFGVPVDRYGVKLQFDPGSLDFSSPERMPALDDHVIPSGVHSKIDMTAAGPIVSLRILDAPEGTKAKEQRDMLLYDAAEGMKSGLSVGVDFSMFPEDGDVEVDDNGVYHVVRATWRETSITALPQFDDARVTSVAASLTGGSQMDPCTICGQRHAPNMSCATFARQNTPATPPAPAAAAPATGPTFEQFQAWQTAQNTPALPAPAAETPQVVNANPGAVATVDEPLPYRYDRYGNLRQGTHDFSADIAIGHNPRYKGGEDRSAATGRIEAWLKHAFENRDLGKLDAPSGVTDLIAAQSAQRQFAITPANVVNLNYPTNRPDLYVDQLDYLYPMFEAVNKGSLDSVTPFVIPKFNSSSGLVTDHVSGTEPTPGAFTATAQTITPSPLSGKVEMLREVFDQGGNPQASGLIWRQMVRGWYEGLEAAVQAFLVANAASIPDIALGIAVTDAALDQALASAVTALQFIRGGDRFSKVFTQIDLYQKLAKAVDSTGRPLYPSFGAMNSAGLADPSYNYLNVRGKTFVPAWATAATGTVAASSWMFDPDVVALWSSTPQRIDLEWRVAWVDIGIWGYKALAVTDFSRTRELIYDPV